jgi:hypothetical protein
MVSPLSPGILRRCAGGVNAKSRDKFGFDFVPINANMFAGSNQAVGMFELDEP